MTNEAFLRDLKSINRALDNEISAILEHARKLVAVDEAAKKCFKRMVELGLDEEDDFDNLMVLIDTRERE